MWSLELTPKAFLTVPSFQKTQWRPLSVNKHGITGQTDSLLQCLLWKLVHHGTHFCCVSVTDALNKVTCPFLFPQCKHKHFTATPTALPLVSGYDAVGHDVEDREQEEANLKRQNKNPNVENMLSYCWLQCNLSIYPWPFTSIHSPWIDVTGNPWHFCVNVQSECIFYYITNDLISCS